MIIKWDGRDWDFDQSKLTVRQAIAMQMEYGYSIDGWKEALQVTDPRAIQCLYWLMLQQGGAEKPIRDCDFDLMAYVTAVAEAAGGGPEPEPEPEAPPVPTRPAGHPSPGPGSPPATTRPRAARREGEPATA